MKKTVLALIVFIATVIASSNAFALVDVEGRYWFTSLTDSVKVSGSGITGSNINLTRDLGMDGKKDFWEGRISLELGNHRLRYGFMPLKWAGSRTIGTSINFNGQTFKVSDTVNAKLTVDYHRLDYEYSIINVLENRLGILLGVKYFDTEARLNDTTLGIARSKSIAVPIPTVGLAGQVSLPFFLSANGEVTGMTIGSKAYIVDGEAGVNFKPIPLVKVSGGYRVFKLHLEDSNNVGNLTLKGPFVNLSANF